MDESCGVAYIILTTECVSFLIIAIDAIRCMWKNQFLQLIFRFIPLWYSPLAYVHPKTAKGSHHSLALSSCTIESLPSKNIHRRISRGRRISQNVSDMNSRGSTTRWAFLLCATLQAFSLVKGESLMAEFIEVSQQWLQYVFGVPSSSGAGRCREIKR